MFLVQSQKIATVAKVNLVLRGFLHVEKPFGYLGHFWIKLHGVHVDIRIIIVESSKRAAATETDHQHALRVRVPQEWNLKILGIFKVSINRNSSPHASLR